MEIEKTSNLLEINGQIIDKVLKLTIEKSLFYYDFDFIYISKDEEGIPLMVIYTDIDNQLKINRIIVAPTTEEELTKYFNKEITMREVVEKEGVMLVDITYEGNKTVRLMKKKDFPESYLPTEDSYYDERFVYEEISKRNKI